MIAQIKELIFVYVSQEIVKRIKDVSTQKNISSNQLLTGCGLGKNTINKMSAGTDILTKNFARIADYLNVSVDYLLGRTDRSELLTTDEAQLLEAYNSSPYVKNAIDGLLGIGNVKQIPINRDDTIKTYAVAFGGQTKQGEITQAEEEKISRLAQIVEERQKAEKDKKE